MSDVGLTWSLSELEGVISFNPGANDLVGDNGLVTAVIISLFTDARARDDDKLPDILYSDDFPNRRGWWADFSSSRPDDSVGSRLWLLSRSKNTTENLRLAEDYAREALQWLIDEKIASKIDCKAKVGGINKDHLFLETSILKYAGENISYRFELLWKETTL